MNINGLGMMQSLYGVYGTGPALPGQENDAGSNNTLCSESLDISGAAKIRYAISQMSDEDREAMRAFHEEMMEAVTNGTFDASEMAADAPDALKSFAEENGIDLEEMLEDMAARMEQFGGVPPQPPPMMYGQGGSEISYQDLTSEFLNTLFSEEDSEEMSLAGLF